MKNLGPILTIVGILVVGKWLIWGWPEERAKEQKARQIEAANDTWNHRVKLNRLKAEHTETQAKLDWVRRDNYGRLMQNPEEDKLSRRLQTLTWEIEQAERQLEQAENREDNAANPHRLPVFKARY